MSDKLFDLEQYAKTARRSAAEGVVLLENENKALPLMEGTKIALFGRSQFNYYKSGTGSGGLVNTKYVTGVKEALAADPRFTIDEELDRAYTDWVADHPFDPGQGWASEPWFQKEMPVSKELAEAAASRTDVAIVLIGRTAGEDQDNSIAEGSLLLTADERALLETVTGAFEKTVVLLNTGNIIDMSWVADYRPDAVAYIWQGGQEGGNGVLDVLAGDVNPGGRLTDTIAKSVEDYPSTKNFGDLKRNIQQEDIYVGYRYFETFAKDKVLYPFGFGLSYTTFDIEAQAEANATGCSIEGAHDCYPRAVTVKACVKNTGDVCGRQVVQVYVEAPQGALGKPARVLAGFAKTEEIPAGASAEVSIEIPLEKVASFDDSGRTGHKNAYVLEAGSYIFYVGANVRDAKEAGRLELASTVVVDETGEAMAPTLEFTRMKPVKAEDGSYFISYEEVPLAEETQEEHRLLNLPKELAVTGDKGFKLKDVAEGKCDMDTFIAQLSDEELVTIVRGEGMSSPKVTPGCGGAFGGVTDALLGFGIPVACCTDGPSGIRMDSGKKAFSIPNGACLASSWNQDLIEELYSWLGMELRRDKIDVLLGPGMNIHRNPQNGRNFEYFSEDPLVTGRCAAAILRGLQRYDVTGTIKHFAMNTQEAARNFAEHVASQRAIREIYLKGFEIAVKEGGASAVMTTYGPVNGYYTASNYDLVTKILRDEWGFEGIVMTDWWAKGNDKGCPGDGSNMAAMIRGQNDLYMVTADAATNTNRDNSIAALAEGTATRAEYQRSAANICRFIMGKPVFARYSGIGDELDQRLEEELEDDDLAFEKMVDCRMGETGVVEIPVSEIDTARGASTMVSVAIRERGMYRLSLTVRTVNVGELAQVPLSIFKDKELVRMITLTGEDSEWQTIDIDMSPSFSTFYLNFFFAAAGMELGSARVVLAHSMEDEIRQAIERMQSGSSENENTSV